VWGNQLDKDLFLDQFKEIETKVEKLIKICKSLEDTNLKLSNKIKKLEEELQGKIEAEIKFADEKALIRSKIDNLLVRLEEMTDN
jgi:protein-arginine kinase activator protein McsA